MLRQRSPLNRTNVELKLNDHEDEEKDEQNFESNQCGIETIRKDVDAVSMG